MMGWSGLVRGAFLIFSPYRSSDRFLTAAATSLAESGSWTISDTSSLN